MLALKKSKLFFFFLKVSLKKMLETVSIFFNLRNFIVFTKSGSLLPETVIETRVLFGSPTYAAATVVHFLFSQSSSDEATSL